MITSEELEAICEGVAFARLPRTLLEVGGADRHTFLHNLCTNDVKSLGQGDGCEAFFTTVQGKTLCHTMLFNTADSVWISTAPGFADQLLPHLDKYLIREDVLLANRSEEVQTLLLTGAGAKQFAIDHLGTCPQALLQHEISSKIANARVVCVPFAKQAYFVFVPSSKSEQLVAQFRSHATELGCEMIEWLRIGARFPSSGRDVKPENLPQEIDRNEQAISFEKGCYLGQETIARLDALGHVNKKLVRLEFDSTSVPPDAMTLTRDGKTVGVVTSAASPEGQKPIGLGMVRVQAIESGETLSSDCGTVRVIV